jgi:hypothetical protein
MEEAKTPGTATTEANKNMLWIIGGAVILFVIVAVIVVLVLISGAQSASSNLTALDPGSPDAATQLLNNKVRDVVIATSTGDVNALGNAFAEIGQISSAEFDLNMTLTYDGYDMDMSMNGRVKGTTAENSAAEFTIKISGNLPGATPLTLTTPVVVDFIALPDSVYFRFSNIVDQISEEQAFGLTYLGIEEDQWYSMPNTATGETESTSPLSSLNPVNLETVQKSLQDLSENPLFINSTAAESRTVAGVEVPCMNTYVNPSAGKSLGISPAGADTTNNAYEVPLEICANPGNFFPAFVGFSGTESGNEFEVGLAITSLNSGFEITAPEGAKNLTEVLENAFSPDSLDLQDYDLEDYDYDYDSLDLY